MKGDLTFFIFDHIGIIIGNKRGYELPCSITVIKIKEELF